MRPSLEEFQDALAKTRGNLTKTAELFGVTRKTCYNWTQEDPEFADALQDSRKRMLDKCIEVGYLTALGIPIVDKAGKVTGWVEKPDASMLRYLLSTLGRDEGFGDKKEVELTGNTMPTKINLVLDDGSGPEGEVVVE